MPTVGRLIFWFGAVAFVAAVAWFEAWRLVPRHPVFRWVFIASGMTAFVGMMLCGVRGARGFVEGPRWLAFPLILTIMPFIIWRDVQGLDPVRFWLIGAPVALLGVHLALRLGEWWLDRHESGEHGPD